MVYNKSKNPKLQYLHIMYVSVHSSVNGIILTLNNYIKAYKLQIYFFFFKKNNKIYAGHIKYIAYWTICTVYIQKFKLSRYLQIHVCLQISCLIYTGISYRYNFLSTKYIASFILANAQSFQIKISVMFFLGKKNTCSREQPNGVNYHPFFSLCNVSLTVHH